MSGGIMHRADTLKQMLESAFDMVFHKRRADFFHDEGEYEFCKANLCACMEAASEQIHQERVTWRLGSEKRRLGTVRVTRHEEFTPLLKDFVTQGLQNAGFTIANNISVVMKDPSDFLQREWLTASVTNDQFKYRFRIEQDPNVIGTEAGHYSNWNFLAPKKLPYDYLASCPRSQDFVGVLQSLHARLSALETTQGF